jgi:hypothetical protein
VRRYLVTGAPRDFQKNRKEFQDVNGITASPSVQAGQRVEAARKAARSEQRVKAKALEC